MKIFNLTQHQATAEQALAGVIDPCPELKAKVSKLLTFDKIPSIGEMFNRAAQLLCLAEREGYECVLLGGAPFFMAALEAALVRFDMRGFYAFSMRESIEEVMADGSVRKVGVFRHVGFVEA